MSLIKELPKIAAKILKNTYGAQPWMKERCGLMEAAHTEAAVKADFEIWCQEQVKASLNPRYPLSEYFKVADVRFGTVFADPDDVAEVEVTDPKVRQIAAASYEQTGYVPSDGSVAKLLRAGHTPEEILVAMREYSATLDEKHMDSGMNKFFTEGAATTVIFTQNQRKGNS